MDKRHRSFWYMRSMEFRSSGWWRFQPRTNVIVPKMFSVSRTELIFSMYPRSVRFGVHPLAAFCSLSRPEPRVSAE